MEKEMDLGIFGYEPKVMEELELAADLEHQRINQEKIEAEIIKAEQEEQEVRIKQIEKAKNLLKKKIIKDLVNRYWNKDEDVRPAIQDANSKYGFNIMFIVDILFVKRKIKVN
jgi:CO/xanthine dehydrogenase FAD-binding subunit